MRIKHIYLENFRNYRRLELDLPAGPTLLYGDNAQGKTNLLESIYYLATTRSPHADRPRQLLNWDLEESEQPIAVGRVYAQVEKADDSFDLELRLIRELQKGGLSYRREALINRRKVRLIDLIGKLPVVLFLPQDLMVVGGSPSARRRYIDITLCQSDPIYCRRLSSYNKVLEQRNALLKSISEQGIGLDVLPAYTEKLIESGSYVFWQRAISLAALGAITQEIHNKRLTGGGESVILDYLPRLSPVNNSHAHELGELGIWLSQEKTISTVADRFRDELEKARSVEVASGQTMVGPHRDDWRFQVDSKDLGKYGSRGQQRTALLALKLAEIQWMTEKTGATPILLLDEVVAELDKKRRELLLNTVKAAPQSVLTATDPEMFSPGFLALAATLRVTAGLIE